MRGASVFTAPGGPISSYNLVMPGEHDLAKLLRHANPSLHPGEFVYCTVPDNQMPEGLQPICLFRESEGLTMILERSQALSRAIPLVFPCRMITLNVHSALDAVGFLSAILALLTAHGISANCVSAFYHDHLFVPATRADEAIALLQHLPV